MNLKKFLASALVLCTTTFVANTAFAANVEITKDFLNSGRMVQSLFFQWRIKQKLIYILKMPNSQ